MYAQSGEIWFSGSGVMTFQSNLVNNFWHVCQFLATCLFQDLIFCSVGSLKWCFFNSSDIWSLKWLKETAKMPHIHAERNSRVWNNGPNLEKKHLFCLMSNTCIIIQQIYSPLRSIKRYFISKCMPNLGKFGPAVQELWPFKVTSSKIFDMRANFYPHTFITT